MNKRGWTPPYIPIIIVVVGTLTLIFGWKTLIYVAALFVGVGLCTWVYDRIAGTHEEASPAEEQTQDADAPAVPEVKDEASVPGDVPILLEVKVGKTASADTPVSGEKLLVPGTSWLADFILTIVFFGAILVCMFLPSFALGMWGPTGGILAGIACGGLWIKFGPPPFPVLLPGCLAILIPGNALAVIAISLIKLISG